MEGGDSMIDERTLPPGLIDTLRAEVRGAIITRDDESYDEARRVWNGQIDRRPAIVVRCAGPADVIAAVRFAAAQDQPLAVRGGGHSFAGFGTCDDGIVVDLGAMRGVRVDPRARRAIVGGGATWGDLDHETAAFGLATTGGLISTTGVGGLTLGGGIGWLMRKYGMACDNLVGADVVTASGEYLHASAEEHPDLFWALRGGGGNFGVVTALEYQLHPVSSVVGGALLFPLDHLDDVLAAYADATRQEPDELCSLLEIATAPDTEDIDRDHRARSIVAFGFCHCGDPAAGRAVVKQWQQVAPVVGNFVDEMPYPILQTFYDADYPKGLWVYMRSHYLSELTHQSMEALVGAAGERSLGRSIIDLHHMGGAAARVPAGETAFDHRDAEYAVLIAAATDGEPGFDTEVAWGRRQWEALAPHSTGGAYENFMSDQDTNAVRSAWNSSTHARLATVKNRYDPDNRLHFNHNIQASNVGNR
jgi:FAD/FMN-containing dehydrogenase